MIARSLLTGLVLAGGQGRRMQAAALEKGLLELNGKPLVEHACGHLAPYVDKVLISANTNLDRYAQYGDVVPDDLALGEYSGPLAGIASALRHVATPWLVVLPVDVPCPPVDLIERLCASVGDEGPRIAYARTSAGVHPLCMVAHSSLVDGLYDFLLSGERKVQFWQRQNDAVPVLFDDVGDAFFNINTPEDLLRASGLTE
ncbi:molybdenum cofactor guanylyltransferase MobA [Pollutimonas bauzanensis]|uniref:molybdenum cofactor guanylyltransferase MobA n=1 Tax=Pollutimonas bauzanensis TaxID=658167 RepID=UPI00334222B3